MTVARGPWVDKMLVKRMSQLCGMRRSFDQIAVTLSREFNIKLTRNMVLGKCKRLGLTTGNTNGLGHHGRKTRTIRPRRERTASFVVKKLSAAPIKVPEEREPESYVEGDGIEADRLVKGVCHWPLGGFHAMFPFRYCGQPGYEDHSYCKYHHERSLRKNEQR